MEGQDKYIVASYCCHYYAFYNSRYKNHKPRAGMIKLNGKELFGTYTTVPGNNKYAYSDRDLHSWVETDEGKIVDWVINYYAKRTDKIVFTKEEVGEMGFEYIPYTNEERIIKALKQSFMPVFDSRTKEHREQKWREYADWWKHRWATPQNILEWKPIME